MTGRNDFALREQLRALAERYPRYGCPTLHDMLKSEGLVINPKRTYRVYREEGLQVRTKRRKNVWGVGRHRYGGQIFDYWASPCGVIHEHWTDTDLANHDHQISDRGVAELQDYWGPPPTPAFVVSRWNGKAVRNVARILAARASGSNGSGA